MTKNNDKRSYRFRHGSLAFTVVELNIVILILLLAAALIIPSIKSIQQSRAIKDLEGSVARLPIEAKNDAVKSQVPVTLLVQNNELVLQEAPATGAATTIKQVALGQDLQVTAAQLNGQTADPGTWTWTAYPDGTSDAGGLQFTEGSAIRSLVLYKDGTSNWKTGELPDVSTQQWPAGQLQRRIQ